MFDVFQKNEVKRENVGSFEFNGMTILHPSDLNIGERVMIWYGMPRDFGANKGFLEEVCKGTVTDIQDNGCYKIAKVVRDDGKEDVTVGVGSYYVTKL